MAPLGHHTRLNLLICWESYYDESIYDIKLMGTNQKAIRYNGNLVAGN